MTDNKESWKTEWRKYWEPVTVSDSLLICPAWKEASPQPGQLVLRLDTIDAFGTGTHETTRLCLRAIEEIIRTSSVDSVLDIGCGSGVLSIAAAMLGVKHVVGIDIDGSAIKTSAENALTNNVPHCDFSITPLREVTGTYSLVCANIISSVLLSLWLEILSHLAPNGRLVLSGLLVEELPVFVEKIGLQPSSTCTEGEWACLVFAPNVHSF